MPNLDNDDAKFRALISESREEMLQRIQETLREQSESRARIAQDLIGLNIQQPLTYEEIEALATHFISSRDANNSIRALIASRMPFAINQKLIEEHKKLEDDEQSRF